MRERDVPVRDVFERSLREIIVNWPKTVTFWLIVVSVSAWLLWDPVAYLIGAPRGEATESVTIGTWLDKSLWLTFLLFVLCFHLLASGDGQLTWKHLMAATLGALVGFCLTFFS